MFPLFGLRHRAPPGGAGPTISNAVNSRGNAVGDTAGGYTVTLTVTGAGAGSEAVTFGGNSATSVVVVNPTTVTCTAPAGAGVGLVDVVFSTVNGTATLANGWRYWDPSAIASTGWWRETRTTSGSNVTQWTDKSGNARHLPATATWPQVGSTLNGQPTISFDGSLQRFVSTIQLSALLGVGAFTLLAIAVPASVSAGGYILADAGTWSFFSVSGAFTSSKAGARAWDTGYRTAECTTTLANGTAYAYEARADGANLHCLINGAGDPVSPPTFSGLGGSNFVTSGDSYNGRLAEMLTIASELSATVRGYFVDYAYTRYALS